MENEFTSLNCSTVHVLQFYAFSIFIWTRLLITRISYTRIPFERWQFLCIRMHRICICAYRNFSRTEIVTMEIQLKSCTTSFLVISANLFHFFSHSFWCQITLQASDKTSQNGIEFMQKLLVNTWYCVAAQQKTMVNGVTSRQVSKQSTELTVANRKRRKSSCYFHQAVEK